MKLLILTQALDSDDSNLGFFHTWVGEFTRHCEKVTVICLREGVHRLPQSVAVLSLGKERGSSKFERVRLFFKYIRQYKGDYDAVFVHMNPEYIVLGGWLWRRWHKKIGLWYAHKSVTWALRRAVSLADVVFTVSFASFKVATPKLAVVGHGIDTEHFKPAMRVESVKLRIATAGRVAASKHLMEMLAVLDELERQGTGFVFTIIGAPVVPAEERYAERLREEVARRPYREQVHFAGAVAHEKLPALLSEQDLCFNFATTGNMDKAGLEALAAGVPLFATNRAFKELLEPYGLFLDSTQPQDIARAISEFMGRRDRSGVVATLRNKIIEEHSLERLIPKILEKLAS